MAQDAREVAFMIAIHISDIAILLNNVDEKSRNAEKSK
jgi:hypothetical protein